ncbi:hypothetical protein [Rhizobium mongolense]|uniref:hypothetical protein n=1 Tax=Rhizobium mongolense TaxID=57676 RepID=UPI0034A2553F
MLVSKSFPIVGDSSPLGHVARVATDAQVGAIVVASTSGLWVMPIGMIPDQNEGVIGSLVASLAKRLEPPGYLAQTDFTLVSIADGFAQIEFDINHPWRIDVVYGYKECDANRKHTYPPKYSGNYCSPPCKGKLILKP